MISLFFFIDSFPFFEIVAFLYCPPNIVQSVASLPLAILFEFNLCCIKNDSAYVFCHVNDIVLHEMRF